MQSASWKAVLDGIDKDLLLLESASLLAIAADTRFEVIRQVCSDWADCAEDPDWGSVENAIDETSRLTQAMVRVVGVELIKVFERVPVGERGRLLRECASKITAVDYGDADAHICIALLNLYSEAALIDGALYESFVLNDVLARAWQGVRSVAERLHVPMSEGKQPRRVSGDPFWTPHEHQLVGDYAPWSQGLGAMFQTLAGWDSIWTMPPKPAEGDHVSARAAYWAPLVHLVLGPLAWSDPALELARWILAGMPETTPELSLIRRKWGSTSLAYFCHSQMDWIPSLDPEGTYFGARKSGLEASGIFERSAWKDIYTGSGELHMGPHLGDQLLGSSSRDGRSVRELFQSDSEASHSHSQVLVLDRFGGWYRRLTDAGNLLQSDDSARNTEIHLIAHPIGVLGTFRKSPITGRWYSGSHDTHMLGHGIDGGGNLARTIAGTVNSVLMTSIESKAHESLAWNIATEICRRHSQFSIISCTNASGLGGFGLQDQKTHIVEMLFEIVPGATSSAEAIRPATSPQGQHVSYANAMRSSYERAVAVTEDKLGLATGKSKATNPRLLTYRVIGSILAQRVFSKQHWSVRRSSEADVTMLERRQPAEMSTSNLGIGLPPHWLAILGNDEFWILLRDGSLAAAVTEKAVALNVGESKPVDVMKVFEETGRNLTATVSKAFSSVLK